jgi:uncharacterized membrane protein YagU involved in acid resistance
MTGFATITAAALLSGILDLSATTTVMKSQGIPPERLLQVIASGALGQSSFQGGKNTAAIGLFFHFFIAFALAVIYYQSSRRLPFLIDHPFFSGALYGIAVHLVMSRIVVPLSAAPRREFSAKAFLTQLLIHIVFVGLPIALTVSHLSR